MQNLESTIESQFATSPTLGQLLQAINQWIDPTTDLDTFYSYVFNIQTAEGFGLDNWGKILGVTRTFQVPQITAPFFGFNEQNGPYVVSFNTDPFYSGNTGYSNVSLDDGDYRTLLLVKAMANIGNSSAATYNAMLMTLFPGIGNCYVEDWTTPGSSIPYMTMQLTFSQQLTAIQIAILTESGVFAAPTGVNLTIAINTSATELTTAAYRVTAAESPYTAPGPGWYFVDCSAGSVVFMLPTPVAGQSGECFIKRADVTYRPGATITVQPPPGFSMFDGTGATVLTQHDQAATFAADGISVIGAF